MIALTFDDGPNAVTDKILDLFEKYSTEDNPVKATFFVVGYNAKCYVKTMKRAYEMGCEIGNHSNTHLVENMYDSLTVDEMNDDMAAVDAYIEEATGAPSTLLRPPFGSVSRERAKQINKFVIGWNVDPEDWKLRDAEKVSKSVLETVKNGDIVIMHDIYKTTKEALETIIPALIEDGYRFVTVSELLNLEGHDPHGMIYYSIKYAED